MQKHREILALLLLGDACLANEQFQKATQHFSEALEFSKGQINRYQETQALHGLGKAYEKQNQPQRAIQYCQEALQIAKRRGYRLLEDNARSTIERLTTGILLKFSMICSGATFHNGDKLYLN